MMWPFSTLIRETSEAAGAEDRSFITFDDYFGPPTYSGQNVSESNSVKLPAVYKCISLNSEMISSLPIDVFARRGPARVPYQMPFWLQSPNDLQTTAEFIAMSQVSLDLDGNCFWLKASADSGALVGLSVLDPTQVEPKLELDADDKPTLIYYVQTAQGKEAMTPRSIVHLRAVTIPGQLRGLSPIACAKETIGIGLSAEQFGAQFFGAGANLSGVIESPGRIDEAVADLVKKQFAKKHGGISKSHAVGILSGGATWKPMSVKPDEAQFLESRRYTATEIANLFGCPPELVTDVEGAKGYVTALHARLRLWYLTGLLPRITRLETALSGLLPRPAYVKFNTNALLRMDPAERTAFYQAAQLGQWMTRNEIRALEEMDPMTGGDQPLKSVQWQENQPDSEPDEVTQ